MNTVSRVMVLGFRCGPAVQDLIDALPDVLEAAAGIPLAFHVRISIADGPNLTPATIDAISKLLEEVSSDLRLKT
jgi:hypothetical protein